MVGSQTNVAEFLLAGKPHDRIALRFVWSSHSYGELQSASDCMAHYCTGLGLQKGDRVVLISDNSLLWVVTYLGVLRAGLVCVPLPPTTSARELEYVLNSTEARLVAVQAKYALENANCFRGVHVLTDQPFDSLPSISHTHLAEIKKAPAASGSTETEVSPNDLATIMFTSGSTGKPRGVMISHRNITANTESIIASLALTERDRTMAVLPFHYCFGTSLLHTHLRVGGSLVVDSRFMYPEVVLQRMEDTQCTGFAGVPSHYQILLRRSSLRKKAFPHLRYMQQAGGHLAPQFIRELQEAIPHAQVFIMYGQTEGTARLSCLPAEFLNRKLGSIGKGIPRVELRVVDQAGREVEPGQPGEIVAMGENVALGYWRAPEETAATFRNGELHTGDVATIDEDGFLYVVDRVRDFLKCGGKRISCRQIEDRLLECEDLLEIAVVGIQDDVLGEAVKAFVVSRKPNATDIVDTIQAFSKGHLPSQLVPREIVVLRTLPKNDAGKILKQRLVRAR